MVMTDHYAQVAWPKSLFSYQAEAVVCVDCGYLERYLQEKSLARLQKRWQKRFGSQGPIIR